MIRIATIGTSMITGRFIRKAAVVPTVKVTAMYSRKIEKAKAIGEEYGVSIYYDDLNKMAKDPQIDAVYVASPNSLHYEQTLLLLRSGKHVICEKSMGSNVRETEEMFRVAKENGVVLLEAMRTLHDPAFQAIKNNLKKIGRIRKACLEYCQYSSRYDYFMAGQLTNIFDPKFSAGALQDIGVYCVGAMVDIFGVPQETNAYAVLLPNGIDGCGTIHASYPGMVAEISYSKITRSDNCSQIQGEKGTIYFEPLANPKRVWITYIDGSKEEIEIPQVDWNMNYEIAFFADAIEGKADASYYERISKEAAKIQQRTREQIGLVFPADKTAD